MFQRLAQFGVALLQFLEQPNVLDCDHRRVGECLEQRDLFVSKGTDFKAADDKCTDRISFSQEWRNQHRAIARYFLASLGFWVLGIDLRSKIMNMDHFSFNDGATYGCTTSDLSRSRNRHSSIYCRLMDNISIETPDDSLRGIA